MTSTRITCIRCPRMRVSLILAAGMYVFCPLTGKMIRPDREMPGRCRKEMVTKDVRGSGERDSESKSGKT